MKRRYYQIRRLWYYSESCQTIVLREELCVMHETTYTMDWPVMTRCKRVNDDEWTPWDFNRGMMEVEWESWLEK